jgi:hypothetical protein
MIRLAALAMLAGLSACAVSPYDDGYYGGGYPAGGYFGGAIGGNYAYRPAPAWGWGAPSPYRYGRPPPYRGGWQQGGGPPRGGGGPPPVAAAPPPRPMPAPIPQGSAPVQFSPDRAEGGGPNR